MINYASVCSGIEAPTVAWHSLGWKPQWFSEIEPFPSSVLAHHYPDVPNLGDMTNLQSRDEYNARPIDLLVGGTPCQSFSVAGLRKGLADPRGNLALTYLRIVAERSPSVFVWENVPGVLSSNGGRDFGAFLGAVAELGYGFAYRVLDAQHVRVDSHTGAVPQRRRRLFVVGVKGRTGATSAGKILFEPKSSTGNIAPQRKAEQEVTGTFISRAKNGGRSNSVDHAAAGMMLPVCGTVTTRSATSNSAGSIEEGFADNGNGETLTAGNQRLDPDIETFAVHATQTPVSGTVCPTLSANAQYASNTTYGVRRLMPIECERLQGFPDDYTLVPHRKKPAFDGPRYKAIGNSMAVNVMRWLGLRISEFETC